jgi:hypothetical protein
VTTSRLALDLMLILMSGTLANLAAAETKRTLIQEAAMSDQAPKPPSLDRNAPKRVPPLVRQGVRYEQNLSALEAEFGQVGGILTAHDAKTGAILWSVKVYDNKRKPGLEGDVQDVFFRSMAFDSKGRLVIENERGQRFAVDVGTRKVTSLQ